MFSYTRLALLLGLQASAGALLVACDDGEGASPTLGLDAGTVEGSAPPFSDNGGLELMHKPMYSAYVEGHEAQLPVTLVDRTLRNRGAKFSVSDPTIASVVDTPDGALITVKREGSVVVRAVLDGDTGLAKLTIKKYTEAQWKIGEARYTKAESAVVAPDGGVVNALRLAEPDGRNPSGSCITCHSAQATILRIEDTPTQTAGYSDDELITIFTSGTLPSWVQRRTNPPAFIWGKFHAWTVTEEEKQGLLAYLRTKAPKTQPPAVSGPHLACRSEQGQPVLCDNDGRPIEVPRRDGGSDAGARDAGMSTGLDAGMLGDAG